MSSTSLVLRWFWFVCFGYSCSLCTIESKPALVGSVPLVCCDTAFCTALLRRDDRLLFLEVCSAMSTKPRYGRCSALPVANDKTLNASSKEKKRLSQRFAMVLLDEGCFRMI